MNARQLLIVLGIAAAGFAAAFLISGSSGGGAEPVTAGKQPAAAQTIEVAGATVKASAPAGGALPALKVPKPKPDNPPSTTTTTAPSTQTTAPSTQTTAPSTQTTAPSTQTTAPSTQTTTPPATNNNTPSDTGDQGFTQTGGED